MMTALILLTTLAMTAYTAFQTEVATPLIALKTLTIAPQTAWNTATTTFHTVRHTPRIALSHVVIPTRIHAIATWMMAVIRSQIALTSGPNKPHTPRQTPRMTLRIVVMIVTTAVMYAVMTATMKFQTVDTT